MSTTPKKENKDTNHEFLLLKNLATKKLSIQKHGQSRKTVLVLLAVNKYFFSTFIKAPHNMLFFILGGSGRPKIYI